MCVWWVMGDLSPDVREASGCWKVCLKMKGGMGESLRCHVWFTQVCTTCSGAGSASHPAPLQKYTSTYDLLPPTPAPP
jgi:hypothetical protein